MRTPRPSTGPSPRHPVLRGAASHTRRRLTLRPALLLGLVTALLAPPPPAEARSFAAQTGALSVHPAESRTAPAGAPVRYGWPLAAPHPVVRTFSAPATPYGSGHRGVDLGGTAGEPVLAAGDGTVVFAGQVFDRPVVSIDHQGGLRTTYEPVEPIVRTGNRVRRGEQIGTLQAGHAGCPTTACLHWGARRGQEYVNPIRLVSPGRVRLLPAPSTRRTCTNPGGTNRVGDPINAVRGYLRRAAICRGKYPSRRPSRSLRQPPRSQPTRTGHRQEIYRASTNPPAPPASGRPPRPSPKQPSTSRPGLAQPHPTALRHRQRTIRTSTAPSRTPTPARPPGQRAKQTNMSRPGLHNRPHSLTAANRPTPRRRPWATRFRLPPKANLQNRPGPRSAGARSPPTCAGRRQRSTHQPHPATFAACREISARGARRELDAFHLERAPPRPGSR
jgi:murein DD-endopeptidase MepM/ murein hydrolase activator NlpD